jgi:hypothetical protein
MDASGKRLDFGEIFCETVEDVHESLLFIHNSFAANTAPYTSAVFADFQFALISLIRGRGF